MCYPTMDHHRRDLTRRWGSSVEEVVVGKMALDSEGPFRAFTSLSACAPEWFPPMQN